MLFDRYRKTKRPDDPLGQPTLKKSSLAGTLFRKLPQALTRKGWTHHNSRPSKNPTTAVLTQPRQSLSLPNITLQAVINSSTSSIPDTPELQKTPDNPNIPLQSTSGLGLLASSSTLNTTIIPNTIKLDFAPLISRNTTPYDILGAQLDFVATKRMLKRHSAEQYQQTSRHSLFSPGLPGLSDKPAKRPRQANSKRHSYTFGCLADNLPRLTVQDLLMINTPDTENIIAIHRFEEQTVGPQRSISHQIPSQPKKCATPAHSFSTSSLRSRKEEPPAGTPLKPEMLSTMLEMNQQNMILIDVRNLVDYQTKRVSTSLNVNLPSLLIKRYQRGAVSNFNIENFITTAEGRERYSRQRTSPITPLPETPSSSPMPSILEQKATEATKKRNSRTITEKAEATTVWVVYDEEMNETIRTSQAWTLLNVLERAMGTKDNHVYYLSGGFKAFESESYDKHMAYGVEDEDEEEKEKMGENEKESRLGSGQQPRRSLSCTTSSTCSDKSGLQRRTSLFSLDTQAARVSNANALARRATKRSQALSVSLDSSNVLPQRSHSQPLSTNGRYLEHQTQNQKLSAIPSTPLPTQLTQVMEDEETGLMTADVSPRTEADFGFVISEIIPGFLYVGPEIETVEQADQLENRQIRRVLNMAEECNDNVASLHERVVYRKISARDTVEMKNVDWVMMEAVCFIEDAKRHHDPIYVHCKAGKSRSVTAILAYLISSERWTLKQAYCHVIKARPNMSPNIGFIAELMKMEGKVHGRVSSFMETDWQSTAHASAAFTYEINQLQLAWQNSPLDTSQPISLK
ncbi:hypothetical protein CLU79DRAFT_833435 [Phycomyces nitens]|nr:hypothetical protein CLU79DRAFT_833435 [Phycomyces nitens]